MKLFEEYSNLLKLVATIISSVIVIGGAYYKIDKIHADLVQEIISYSEAQRISDLRKEIIILEEEISELEDVGTDVPRSKRFKLRIIKEMMNDSINWKPE